MSGKAARNPWTLSAKGGAGDDTSVFASVESVVAGPLSPKRDDADGEEDKVCASCNVGDVTGCKPCDNILRRRFLRKLHHALLPLRISDMLHVHRERKLLRW